MSTTIWEKQENTKEKKKREIRKAEKEEDNRKNSAKKVLEVKKGVQKNRVRENASTKGLGSCNWIKEGICTKERKGVFTIKEKKRSAGLCRGSITNGHLLICDWLI